MLLAILLHVGNQQIQRNHHVKAIPRTKKNIPILGKKPKFSVLSCLLFLVLIKKKRFFSHLVYIICIQFFKIKKNLSVDVRKLLIHFHKSTTFSYNYIYIYLRL